MLAARFSAASSLEIIIDIPVAYQLWYNLSTEARVVSTS